MTKTKRPCEGTDTDSTQLAGAIGNLADEIRVLRDSIDDLRSSIRWGLQNDRFRSPEAQAVREPVINTDEIRGALGEAMEAVGNDLGEIVSETLRDEFGDFKDCVDQFSLDVQFTVRKIGEHVAAAERYRQGCLFSDDQ